MHREHQLMHVMDGPLLLVVVFYYLPTMIALWREHPRAGAIYVINFLSGWTFIGWVAALAWAFIDTRAGETRPYGRSL